MTFKRGGGKPPARSKPSGPPKAGPKGGPKAGFKAPSRGPRPARSPQREVEERVFDGSPRRAGPDDWTPDLDAIGGSEGFSSRPAPKPRFDDERPARRERPRVGREERPRFDREERPRPEREERPQRAAKPEPRRAPSPFRDEDEERPAAPTGPTRAEKKAMASETLKSGVQTLTVEQDEDGMRVDRFLTARFPQLSFSHIQRIVRKGELRVNGKRADSKDRLEAGQAVRIPPLELATQRPIASLKQTDDAATFLSSVTLYEDSDILVINKPAGLAVQGGSGTTRHVDGMLMSLVDNGGERFRLVHRLDKDTSGCLMIAKTRFAASELAKTFRSRAARKVYWAVVAGVPKPRQGRVSTYLAKEQAERESHMRIARHGEDGASHAVTYYAIVDTMAQKLSWLSLKPVTGRMHQLRVHTNEIGHPIIGDPKYFGTENWELPGGIQNKLHLHARRLIVPHPRGKGTIDVSAPLPAHMEQTFNLLGWDAKSYDPIVEAPEE
jgi:23S rRNA pseudouridine955/2504/2580 synthase